MASRREEMRRERDSLGEIEVPAAALWGASTQRAIANFPVSGEPMPLRLVHALARVKEAAAAANRELGVLDEPRALAIEQAAREVAEGRHDAQFVVDVFQTGSGTSTNMNANEVIARLAERRLGAGGGGVHPNDHVNRSQSSNDVMPTALHVAARLAIHGELLPALERLHACLVRKARAFDDVVKIGRTHLMDATPLRFSQEIAGWARQIELGLARTRAASEALVEVALGGTAVGSGLNRPVGFPERALAHLSRATGLAFREAGDHCEAQASRDAAVEASGALRTLAVSLFKIANDVRLLASGPRCGIGELRLPALQPGSSIMPGKVNPVICESVTQVAAQVIGHDAAIAVGGLSGQLDLNAFLPLIARNLLESIRLLANVSTLFAERCLEGLEVDRERASGLVEGSLSLVTALVPAIGYDAAARIAKRCAETGRTVREVCLEERVLPADELERLLDPRAQTEPDAAR
jgi:fumarate hydratase class II